MFACAESNRRSQGALRWVVVVDQKRRGFGDAGNRCRVIDEGSLSRNRETGQDEDEDGDGEDQEGAGWLALALIDAALLPGRRRGDGTMAWRRGFLSWAISPRVFGISGEERGERRPSRESMTMGIGSSSVSLRAGHDEEGVLNATRSALLSCSFPREGSFFLRGRRGVVASWPVAGRQKWTGLVVGTRDASRGSCVTAQCH